MNPDPSLDGREPPGVTLSDYLGVVWRRKWVILVIVLACTAAAYGFSATRTPQYKAAAQLIYVSGASTADPLTGSSYTDPNAQTLVLQSALTMLSGPAVQAGGEREIAAGGGAIPPHTVSAQVLAPSGSGSAVTTYPSVIEISAVASDAAFAARTANAYAAALISVRTDSQRQALTSGLTTIRATLARMTTRAAKASSDYIMLQQRLHDLQILKGQANGNLQVAIPAAVPSAPFSPKPVRDGAMGFFVGAVLGVALGFLLEQLDTRVRSDDDIARAMRQPILARIPRISKRLLDQSALVTVTEPDGGSAEAFRLLRANLAYMDVDGGVRSLMLTSCLQGEGKSVTIANLAVTMALGGKKVIVVDADLRRPRMHKYFGLPNERGLTTVVTGQSELDESLQAVPVVPTPATNGKGFSDWASGSDAMSRLYLLTSGPQPPNPGEIVSSQRLSGVLEVLAGNADIVLVDTPALLPVGDTTSLADKVDGLIFLVEPDVVHKPQLERAREQLDRLPCKVLGVVVARRKGSHSYYAPRYYYREDDSGRRARVKGSKSGSAAPSA